MVAKKQENNIKIPKNSKETVHFLSESVTRRKFLIKGTTGLLSLVTVVAVGDLVYAQESADGEKIALAKGAVLDDKSLCSGCRTCEMVCSIVKSEG